MPIQHLTEQILKRFQRGALAQEQALTLLADIEQGRLASVHQCLGLPVSEPAERPAATPVNGVPANAGKVVAEVLREMASLLQRDARELEATRHFSEYGLHSVLLVELTRRLNQHYGLNLQPTVFYAHAHAQALAGHIATLLRPAGEPVPVQPPAELRSRLVSRDAVAVVGMSGYLPGAQSLQEFWQHLLDNKDLVQEIPASRWDWRACYGDPAQGKTRAKYGAFIRDADCFDAGFFNISPREAELMDPQHRLLLQAVWHAIEDSGTNPQALAGSRTGLYVGVGAFDYLEVLQAANVGLHPHLITGNVASFLTNRISYMLDLRGPSEPVCTACSASLVAIHHAVEALWRGDCEMALAGGVHLTLTPTGSLVFSRSGMLAEDGQCKTFDARADGYVRGEGVGVIFLKRLSDALRDGNPVYAVVRAVAENHGGHAESLTAPNPQAQADLLREAYRKARIEPASLGYIEAHGTGTKLGDPIEVAALREAFQSWKGARIGLGSVKTNIGHLETAAGIAGVLKVLLMLQHKKIPGNPHLRQANPYIDLQDGPLYLVRDSSDWLPPLDEYGDPLPRCAGVSSFGIGGSNAHIVLEEYVPVSTAVLEEDADAHVIPLSALTDERLRAAAGDLLQFLRAARGISGSTAETTHRAELQLPALRRLVARALDVAEEDIEPEQPFAEYGMTAAVMEGLRQTLQEQGHATVEPAAMRACYNLQELWGLLAPQAPAVQRGEAGGAALPALGSVARTLQVGRKALPQRIAFVVRSVTELEQALQQFMAQPTVPPLPLPLLDEDITQAMQETVRKWRAEGQYRKIADYWERGLDIDWERFYPVLPPPLVSLPGYPFLAQRHWVETTAPKAVQIRLHPLVHQNVSDLHEQQFAAWFDGNEFFIADHKIHGEKVMSSSAPLEMARAAAMLSGVEQVRGLRGVSWKHAIIARESPVRVNTALFFREQQLHFEVRAENGLPACAGIILSGEPSPRPPVLDLDAWRARCDRQLGIAECYDAFSAQDVTLGPGLRVIRNLRYGPTQALAELELDAATLDPGLQYHPALLDGTIQTLIRYEMENRGWLLSVILPSRLGEVNFHASLPSRIFVAVQFSGEGSERNLRTMHYDVTLCDASGQVLLTIRDFAVKLLAADGQRFDLGSSLLAAPSQAQEPLDAPNQQGTLHALVRVELTQRLAQVLKVNEAQIGTDKQMSELGLQSLVLMELADSLGKAFGVQIAPTVFFEYSTVSALTDYCVENFGVVLKKKFGTGTPAAGPVAVESAEKPAELPASRFAGAAAIAQEKPEMEPIAIVGISARLPRADDLEIFWKHLAENSDLVREIPAERWDWRQYYGDQANQTRAKWGGFIDDVDAFDYRFFNYTPREAELMDPQQRLFLQCVWGALEDAGINPASLAGSDTGVFVGGGAMDYLDLVKEAEPTLQAHMVTGNVTTFLANRVSYMLNLRGPSEPVETACSASLIAIHRAVQAIRQGECTMAIAGGANLILTPTITLAFSTMGIISPDGRCRVFDKAANGYVRGEGVGALVLMQRSRAERSGHQIYGLIKGRAENQGGRANSMTAPSPGAQKELLQKAHARAGIDLRTVGYLEAHGTGTALGDPIELGALRDIYHQLDAQGASPVAESAPYCTIGSVKTNIGHLETAAGVAGVIKVLLMLRHRRIPGNPHLQHINPLINLAGTPCRLAQQTTDWPRLHDVQGRELPRRAGVSSFGAGGSNAHLILEEYGGRPAAPACSEPVSRVFPFSARNGERLRAVVRNTLAFLQGQPHLPPDGVAYTLQVGREAMACRSAWHAGSLTELCGLMQAWLDSGAEPATTQREPAAVGRDASPLQLAAAWSAGAELDWAAWYGPRAPQRLSLPTYPFAQERCWVGAGLGRVRVTPMGGPRPAEALPVTAPAPAPIPASGASRAALSPLPAGTGLLDIIARITKLSPQDIAPQRQLHELGIDSILSLSLLNELERHFALGLTIDDVNDKSVAELVALTQGCTAEAAATALQPAPARPAVNQEAAWHLTAEQLLAWPELQILQKRERQRPVFWFYSGFGTVQPYIPLARALSVPFLAFQASGVKGEKKHFASLSEIARYQAEIMMQVQPHGAFRLGGYSLGGTLAYEAARHLQQAGRHVENIVMLDSFFPDRDFPRFSRRASLILTFISFLHMNGLTANDLGTRDVAEQDLFGHLVDIGLARGLKYGRDELAAQLEKYMNLTDESLLNAYEPAPLPDNTPALHFFQRRDLHQFFCVQSTSSFDNADILQNIAPAELQQINQCFGQQDAHAWKAVLPNMTLHTTVAEDHFRLLSNHAAFSQIHDQLQHLYAPG